MASTSETNVNIQTTGNEKVLDFSGSDFAQLVETTLFVDKTLMIKEIFNGSSRILITAPRQFGKSVNMEMIKQFLEIKVDETTGRPKPVHTTENYRLFKDNNLDICNDIEFFNKHFGKHPVIHIDCKPLGEDINYQQLRIFPAFDCMLKVFRIIVMNSFSQHKYLLNNYSKKKLFYLDDNYDEYTFKKCFSHNGIYGVTEWSLADSFKYLSRILYRYFGKEVFVLIDNYDALFNSMFILKSEFRVEMSRFVYRTLTSLLSNNQHVERALLTGILPVTADNSFFLLNPIDCCCFMDSRFHEYYGLTCDELHKIVKKLIKDDSERNKTKQMIDENYCGYIRENQSSHMYSIWSVMQYLYRGEVSSYWYNDSWWKCFNVKLIFKISKIREGMEKLLLGNELHLMNTLEPMSAKDVFEVADIIASDSVKNASCVVMDRFFIILYHFGYFYITKYSDWGSVNLKIPNEEIKLNLAKLVLEVNEEYYGRKAIDKVRSAIDLFQPDGIDQIETYETFQNTVENWFKLLSAGSDFLTCLFMILASRPEYSKTVTHRVSPNGPLVIQLQNKHKIEIYITAKEDTSDCDVLEEAVVNAVKQIADNEVCVTPHCKVFIGIGYLYVPVREIHIAGCATFKKTFEIEYKNSTSCIRKKKNAFRNFLFLLVLMITSLCLMPGNISLLHQVISGHV